jgi:hypothetical protein
MQEPGLDDDIPEGIHTVKFKQWDCSIERGTYSNGRVALQLNDLEDGMPIATATVNMPDVPLEPNEVIIKNYSENSGISKTLMEAGLIGPPLRKVLSGFVTVEVHQLIN